MLSTSESAVAEPDWLGLRGQRVLVAGAGGIGAACAASFLDAGATVVAADLSAERLSALDPRIHRVEADLTTVEGCEAAVRACEELTRGHLDAPGVREHYTSLVPAGRLGSVEDLTGAVLFLASRRAAFITGQVLYVDGGRTLV